MPFLNCVQHVLKSPRSMLQPRTNEQVHQKAPFTIIHQMNEHKNHDGCLSESIKNQISTSKNIRRFYSFGWPTEKQSSLATNEKKDLEKRHLIGLDNIPLDLIPPSLGKALFLSLYPVLLSPDIVSTMGIPEQLFRSITQCSWGIIDTKYT